MLTVKTKHVHKESSDQLYSDSDCVSDWEWNDWFKSKSCVYNDFTTLVSVSTTIRDF